MQRQKGHTKSYLYQIYSQLSLLLILQILLSLYTYIEDHTRLLLIETIAYNFLVRILTVSCFQ